MWWLLLGGALALGIGAVMQSDQVRPFALHASIPLSEAQWRFLSALESQIGTVYRWGGHDPATGFDCSGYVSWGLVIARLVEAGFRQTAAGFTRILQSVSADEARPGDLVIYGKLGKAPDHVEVLIDGSRVIGARHSAAAVAIYLLPEAATATRWGILAYKRVPGMVA